MLGLHLPRKMMHDVPALVVTRRHGARCQLSRLRCICNSQFPTFERFVLTLAYQLMQKIEFNWINKYSAVIEFSASMGVGLALTSLFFDQSASFIWPHELSERVFNVWRHTCHVAHLHVVCIMTLQSLRDIWQQSLCHDSVFVSVMKITYIIIKTKC